MLKEIKRDSGIDGVIPERSIQFGWQKEKV